MSHGDTDAAVDVLGALANRPAAQLAAMGETARSVLHDSLSQSRLCGEMCDRIETTMSADR